MNRRRFLALTAGAVALLACDRGSEEPSPSASPVLTRTPSPPSPTSVAPASSPTSTPPPIITATASPVPRPRLEPVGFPLDRQARCGRVEGPIGARTIRWGVGPTVERYSIDDQPSPDPERANASGWNARVHVEYEGQPAVDWYVPVGAPVVATMDGVATLYVITLSNPFEVYGVSREPYLGNPDRARAPIVPFPGPGGGKGVFVRVEGEAFRTEYAHLDLRATLSAIRPSFIDGYGLETPYEAEFAPLRDYRAVTAIARWEVRAGDLIGMTGDTGYSEAPHLHYTIARGGSTRLLCPTTELGFEDGGWLARPA